jgi:hypothetical protein
VAALAADAQDGRDEREHAAGQQPGAVVAHEVRQVEEEARRAGQRLGVAGEERRELGEHVDEQEHDHAHGQDRHEGRVGHGALDLLLRVDVALHELGDAAEHDAEVAGHLAGAHEGQRRGREGPGVLAHGRRERPALLDGAADRAHEGLHVRADLLLLEHLEGAREVQARIEHDRELRDEVEHALLRDLEALEDRLVLGRHLRREAGGIGTDVVDRAAHFWVSATRVISSTVVMPSATLHRPS